jgi:hypothetical protein
LNLSTAKREEASARTDLRIVKLLMVNRCESMEVIEDGDEGAVNVEETGEDAEEPWDEEPVVEDDPEERVREDQRLESRDGDRLGTCGAMVRPESRSRICCRLH